MEVRTVPGLLARNAHDAPDRDAVVTHDEVVTWSGLAERVGRAAAGLADDVGRGTRVGLLLENGVDWVVIAFAVLARGGVLVPLSTLLSPAELAGQLRTAGVDRLVLSDGFRGRDYHAEYAAVLADLSWVRSPAAVIAGAPAGVDPTPVPVGPDDDGAIVFTSGSRGSPKGTLHTHRGMVAAVAAGLEVRCVGPGERLYLPMPLFWTGGFAGGLMTALVANATLLTEAVPEPDRTLDLLVRGRATLFRGWPDQAAALAAHARAVGRPLPALGPASLTALLPEDRQPPPGARANLFGMTETFGPYCGDRLDTDLPPGARGSCGRPLPGVSVRIVDPDSGARLAAGLRGEVEVAGQLMRGVVGRPAAEVFTADGFYPTGDVGHLDADGRLWFHGRLDDAVKVSGATVYPSEVEAGLLGIAGVERALVVPVGDGAATRIGALVVPAADRADLTGDEVRAGARTRLSAFKVPRDVVVLRPGDDVPRLPTGKPDVSAARNLLAPGGP